MNRFQNNKFSMMLFNNRNSAINYNIRHVVIIFLLVTSSCSAIYAQKRKDAPPPLKERLFYGGNFGLQFGTITDIQIAPVIGIWLLPRVNVAIGPDYRFYKYRDDKTHIYGGKVYSQLVVIQDISSFIPLGSHTGIFLHIEDELLSLESAFWKYPPYLSDRFNINTVLAGGGISQQIGRRSSLNMMALWVLNDSGYDFYGNPEIRVSFTF
jgi:hypothetical protein